ncbi:MAG: hypothetical protein IKU01_01715 [Bacteroidales bacterium]|nr:hypothetical protein [Bacteroidales bacterium]
MKNRLNLDWALSTSTERSDFINEYVRGETFAKVPPTEEELETMGNYILWGKDEDGLNVDQRKEVELPRRYATWTAQNVDSLDEKIECPTFIEGTIQKIGEVPQTRKVKETFSRKKTRESAPDHLLAVFEELWERIDYIELCINLYEERTGKREKPPRDSLLQRFSEEDIEKVRKKTSTFGQYKYLKLKHLLVELRKEQYTLRDSFLEGICRRTLPETSAGTQEIEEEVSFFKEIDVFEEEVPVFPLGLIGEENEGFWRKREELVPRNFGEEELLYFSKIFWKKKAEENAVKEERAAGHQEFRRWFDFRDLEMVYQLLLEYQELEKEGQRLLRNTSRLIQTFFYYAAEANLTEIQREILQLKMDKEKNQDIARLINRKYGKSYTANYISTIFRQKIIPEINGAAALHVQIVQSLPFEEEFKTCSKCGRVLLRDPVNFVRKSRAKDGLSSRCKMCDKLEREKNKR